VGARGVCWGVCVLVLRPMTRGIHWLELAHRALIAVIDHVSPSTAGIGGWNYSTGP
jgi:hypothetical protein